MLLALYIWFAATMFRSPRHLDKNSIHGHFRGFLVNQTTEQLQSHVHLSTHTTAHVGHERAHHLLLYHGVELLRRICI